MTDNERELLVLLAEDLYARLQNPAHPATRETLETLRELIDSILLDTN